MAFTINTINYLKKKKKKRRRGGLTVVISLKTIHRTKSMAQHTNYICKKPWIYSAIDSKTVSVTNKHNSNK